MADAGQLSNKQMFMLTLLLFGSRVFKVNWQSALKMLKSQAVTSHVHVYKSWQLLHVVYQI